MANLTNAKRHLENVIEYLTEEMANERDIGMSLVLAKLIVELSKQERYLDAAVLAKSRNIVVHKEDYE